MGPPGGPPPGGSLPGGPPPSDLIRKALEPYMEQPEPKPRREMRTCSVPGCGPSDASMHRLPPPPRRDLWIRCLLEN